MIFFPFDLLVVLKKLLFYNGHIYRMLHLKGKLPLIKTNDAKIPVSQWNGSPVFLVYVWAYQRKSFFGLLFPNYLLWC